MTLFSACLKLTGLSHQEAADFFGVRLDTVKKWSQGKNNAPDFAWDKLRILYETQLTAAEEAIAIAADADEIQLNEHGPRAAEWPSKGAHMATLAMVALDPDCPPIAKDDLN